MTRLRDRIFAGFGAGLFLISACAITGFALLQGSGDSPAATSQQSCVDNKTEQTIDVPEIYKPDGKLSKLESVDISQGSGAAAKAGDCLVMKYYGTFASSGDKFDENFTDATGFAFTLGKGQVITGWDQGLVGMKAGGMRRLAIPSDMAYGASGSCKSYNQTDSTKCDDYSIPPDSDLVFVVKLIRIQKVGQ
jgi:peptidylprolyl isomerase